MITEPPESVARALALLEGATIRRHADFSGPIRSPAEFAGALGYAPERIVKTLLLADRGTPKARRLLAPADHYAGAALSAHRKIDMKAAARALGWNACEVASAEELETVTGFPRWGVSPLGLALPILLDAALLAQETILVGGGAAGVEIEAAPRPLAETVGATIAEIALRE